MLDYTSNRLHLILKQIGSFYEVRITKDQQFVDWRLKLFHLTCWICPKFNLKIITNKILTRRYFRREDGRFTYSVFTEVFISNRFSLSSFERQSYSNRCFPIVTHFLWDETNSSLIVVHVPQLSIYEPLVIPLCKPIHIVRLF